MQVQRAVDGLARSGIGQERDNREVRSPQGPALKGHRCPIVSSSVQVGHHRWCRSKKSETALRVCRGVVCCACVVYYFKLYAGPRLEPERKLGTRLSSPNRGHLRKPTGNKNSN